jgi:hypothetical protein
VRGLRDVKTDHDPIAPGPPERPALIADLIGPPAVPLGAIGTQWDASSYGITDAMVAPAPPQGLEVHGLSRDRVFEGPWAHVRFATADAVAARFPDRPWVWAPADHPFWATPHPEWIALVDLAFGTRDTFGKGRELFAPWSAVARPGDWDRRLPAGTGFEFGARGTRRVSFCRTWNDYEIEENHYDALVLREADGAELDLPLASAALDLHSLASTALVAPIDHPAARDPGAGSALLEAVTREVEAAWLAAALAADRALFPVLPRLEPIFAAVRSLDAVRLRRVRDAFREAFTRDRVMPFIRAELAAHHALTRQENPAFTLLSDRANDTIRAIAEREISDPDERREICRLVLRAVANILIAVIAGDRLDAAQRDLVLRPLAELAPGLATVTAAGQ